MKCINPKMKELVSMYQFNLLGGGDKLKVEAHLLECDACFEEVYRLSPTVKMMEEAPEFFLDALQTKEPSAMQIDNLTHKIRDSFSNLKTQIFPKISELWKVPITRVLIPVAAVAIILLIVWSPNAKKYSDLAIIEDVSSSALKLRGLVSDSQSIFDEGVKYFEEENYKEAIQNFRIFVKKKKKDAYGHYYLGVSLLMTDNVTKGIEQLEVAAKLCKNQGKELLLERCYWYLGNAYLKDNQAEKALKNFRNVVVIGGEFKEKAIQQMSRIENLKGE